MMKTAPQESSSLVRDLIVESDKEYSSPTKLLTCPYVVVQTLLNVAISFFGPLVCFWVLFHVLGSSRYYWLSGPVLGPILASPIASPICALAFAPISIPQAVKKRWLLYVKSSDVSRGIWTLCPFLHLRVGFVRHLILGFILSCFAIPLMLGFVLVFLIDEDGYLSDTEQILASVTYIAILPLCIIPLGFLGFAIEPNLDRTLSKLQGKSFVQQALCSPRC